MTVGEAKYAYWRTMLEIVSASGMEKEEWCRRNCVSIKTFQHYEKMSNAAPALAQGDITRKIHKSDSDCEKMSNAAGRACTNRHIANENTEPKGDVKGYFTDRM